MIEEPAQFRAGKIGIEQKAGLRGKRLLRPVRAQLLANAGRAAILPDDGAMDRLARAAVPQERGLALVRDPHGGDVLGREPGLLQGFARDIVLRLPDLRRLVLDPARLGKMLLELALRPRERAAGAIEDDRA